MKMAALYAETRLHAADAPPAASGGRPPADWGHAGQRVVMIGDSRIARWAPRPEAPGLAVWVRGTGGEATRATRARFAADALEPRPDAVVLGTGINDLVAASLNPEAAARLEAAAAENIRAMAEMAEKARVPLILMSVIRPAEPGWLRRLFAWDGAIRSQTARLNGAIRALADRPGVALLDADRILAGDTPSADPLPADHAADALHLTADAYSVLNDGLLTALDSLDARAATQSSGARRP